MNRKFKVILFTDQFPYGSGESFIENEFPYIKQHLDTTIVTSSKSDTVTRDIGINTKLYRIEPKVPNGLRKIKYIMSFLTNVECIKELFRCIKSGNGIKRRCSQVLWHYYKSKSFYEQFMKMNILDYKSVTVIYFYWNDYKPLAFLIKKEKMKNIYIISRIHGYDLYNERVSTGRQAFKHINYRLDKLMFLSESAQEYYRKNLDNYNMDNAIIARLGVENDFGAAPYIRDKTFRLCSCSRVVPLKRIDLIIEALTQIRDIHIEWIHLGAGDEMTSIRDLAKNKLKSQSNIRYLFMGNLPYERLHKFYRSHSFDCYILTSQTEGVPVSVMEALSYGIPVIATDVGGIAEMLSGSKNILLDSNPDPQQVSQAIREIYCLSDESMNDLRYKNTIIWKEKYNSYTNYHDFLKVIDSLFDASKI